MDVPTQNRVCTISLLARTLVCVGQNGDYIAVPVRGRLMNYPTVVGVKYRIDGIASSTMMF